MINVNLMLGDCLDRLKELDDNSVDSIVTDPPYGLSFMGKAWDKSVPSVDVWEECLRVLKPGGHLLAFAGTRTQHRMAVNIEDAGFEIRDMIAWVYGCLSEDTQIVTPDGNKPYTTIKTGDLVLCYDKYNKEYSYQPVEDVYEYNIKDTAYRIQSDFTDQIVSRNHRCLVERGGREIFVFAEELGSQENIPFLEDLSSLQYAISDTYKSTSNKKQNLFKIMQKCNDWIEKLWKNTSRRSFWYGTSSLFGLWNLILPKQKAFGPSSKSSVFSSMQWCSTWGGMETTCPQRTPKLEAGIRESFGGKNDWGNQSKLEGWDNLQATQREPQGSKICSLSRGLFGYGSKRWLYNGASVADGTTSWKNVESDRSSASYQPQSIRQSYRESNAICEQQRPQAIREWTGHKTTLATITPFEYEGKIWCVKVPTGSFVAVRNGKAFTTGNSGFPKSLNISKAIDATILTGGSHSKNIKQANILRPGESRDTSTLPNNGIASGDRKGGSTNDNIATEEAQQWEGWGTALKPALEPITVARKPLSEKTVAANVLKHGTGGINIDESRVPLNGDYKSKPNGRPSQTGLGDNYDSDNANIADDKGRFPANLIHDGSEEVVELFPNTKSGSLTPDQQKNGGYARKNENGIYGKSERGGLGSYNSNDGSAARFFYCAKTSKKDRNEGLENLPDKEWRNEGAAVPERNNRPFLPSKNNHPTVKPTDLMRYLVRMVTPKGGVTLDPFMGSGSTGKAAKLEGFDFIGIELDPDYLEIAKARINSVKKETNLEDFFE